ncbi:CHAT domain-containing protein [Streptomyces sp. TLI_146]|uniref:CHAT domain-containing protein n=1 Tax=Streptomyces sp. TLI_146 TaxID=1938858 RepID=UPI000C6FD3DA|nr:CHAT domain-containing protein [Streptomyces sp. TLI_146]PKV89579.1 CHAT domain-containing protein [Streptomyces sp. TLI_146]
MADSGAVENGPGEPEALAAVQGHLKAIADSGDPSSIFDPDVAADVTRLYEQFADHLSFDCVVALGWVEWHSSRASDGEAARAHETFAVLRLLPAFLAGEAYVPSSSMPQELLPTLAAAAMQPATRMLQAAGEDAGLKSASRGAWAWMRIVQHIPTGPGGAGALANLSVALRLLGERGGGTENLDRAVTTARHALTTMADDEPQRPAATGILATALWSRYEHSGDPEDLDAAVEAARTCANAGRSEDPLHPDGAQLAAQLLHMRYERSRSLDDLEESIDWMRRAVEASGPDDPRLTQLLALLGVQLVDRAVRTGDARVMDEATDTARRAAAVAPDDDVQAQLAVSRVWHTIFEHTADPTALKSARDLAVRGARALPPESAGRARHLANASLTVLSAHAYTGVRDDLDVAVELGETALAAAPAGHAHRDLALRALSGALAHRFKSGGRLEDLDRALALGRELLDVTGAGHAPSLDLSNLSLMYRTRFLRSGEPADIARAIEAAEAAAACAADARHRARARQQLALSLVRRSSAEGRPEDLDAAIELGRAALADTPRDHPDWVTLIANNALAFLTRYEHSGALEDIDACLASIRDARGRLEPGHPAHPQLLNNEGYALLTRYHRTRSAAEVDAAIDSSRRAAELMGPVDPRLPGCLSNLCLALRSRFDLTAAPADLEEAVAVGRRAVAATAAGDPARATHLNNLGYSLLARAVQDPTATDVRDEAARTFREVLDLLPAGAPARTYPLVNLGQLLILTADTEADAESTVAPAISAFTEAWELTGTAPLRRLTAVRAAALLLSGPQPARAAALLEAAVDLLPALTPRMLARTDQQTLLGTCFELAADAAALVLAARDRPGAGPQAADPAASRALRLTEAGRGVMLGQALDTRGEVTDLRHQLPELAKRFLAIRDRLNASYADDAPGVWASAEPWYPATEARRDLAGQFSAVLDEIRSRPGFDRFLLPMELPDLLAQAAYGPVVVFTVSSHGSHALLIRPDAVTALPLPGLDRDTVRQKALDFTAALRWAPSPTPARSEPALDTLNSTLEWLWDVAAEPVLTALGITSPPSPGHEAPRVWWSPGGLLGLLPLHAAGYHRAPVDGSPATVMDRVVSSYTPTLRALRHARRPLPPRSPHRALVVTMPLTPGAPPLPHTAEEEGYVRAHTPQPLVLTARRRDPLDTSPRGPVSTMREDVMAAMGDCSLVHFACHAVSDPVDPSRSRLLLQDAPLTVSGLAALDLDHAVLAFLSACSTASTGVPHLADEFVNLATAFQLAGFRSVVATLWPVYDSHASDLARLFYAALGSPRDLTPDRAARALHEAVRQLRDRMPDRPDTWAAHLHSGA